MQSYEADRLIQTVTGPLDELAKQIPAEATHSVIGRIPSQGTHLTINGLVWVVERSGNTWLRLRLKKP